MSSILNFHGMYMASVYSENGTLTIIACVILGSSQLFYYFSFYFAYHRFGWRIVNAIKNTDENMISAYKVYETFISTLKLDCLLYLLTVATFFYYIVVKWTDFMLGGLVICFLFFALMIGYSVFGIMGVSKESKCILLSFLGLLPVVAGLKIFLLMTIVMSPGNDIDSFILYQAIIISISDLVIALTLEVLGVLVYQSFGMGLGGLLRKNSEILKTFVN